MVAHNAELLPVRPFERLDVVLGRSGVDEVVLAQLVEELAGDAGGVLGVIRRLLLGVDEAAGCRSRVNEGERNVSGGERGSRR